MKNDLTGISSLDDLAVLLVRTGVKSKEEMPSEPTGRVRPWKTLEVQELLEIRRRSDISERKDISKRIQREVRKQNRCFINEKAGKILEKFKELTKLQELLELPKRKTGSLICDDDFLGFFEINL